VVSEYERRAEDAIENYTEIAATRALTPTETAHLTRLRQMFPEAEEAANHTAEQRIHHPPATPRPSARSPCPPKPTLPRTPIQSKYPIFKGLMLPCHEVLTHPAGPYLL
jgi:hypothetical protein